MKQITEQAQNKVNLVGKLISVDFNHGKTKDGRDYESANLTIRVTQTFNGREEISEIPASLFATQFTSTGKPNPSWKSIQELKGMRTAQTDGYEQAATVRLNQAELNENSFVSRTGQLVTGWRLRSSFVNESSLAEVAAFLIDIFIMDMHPETDIDGDPTGRLIVKGGIVRYGGNLDVVEFIVEAPDSVDYIERNWNINDTVSIKGRIRCTSEEVKSSGKESSWGEDIPETSTKYVRELIITKGDDEGKEEEFAYDPVEIKKAFNVRKAKIEQMQLDATQKAKSSAATAASAASTPSKYNWE